MEQIFLSELDVEILNRLARGATTDNLVRDIGKSLGSIYQRLFNLQKVFGAVTRAHLVAIAIASNIIQVPDLYDESLADGLHIQSSGGGEKQSYHLKSLREEIVIQAAGLAAN